MTETIHSLKPHYPVIVVGGGQAGLSASWHLKQKGIEHAVLEKHRSGHSWRSERWDSFCLVTPNWQCQLPGFPYPGADPHGFMKKDEIVAYLDAFVERLRPPLMEGVTVSSLRREEDGLYRLRTSAGETSADNVILAVGGYHIPNIPRLAERLPDGIAQVHSSRYRNAAQLPEGAVLVVGSGQSGCQIAEDLHLESRRVHLSVGSAPRCPRVYRGRDAVDWLHDMGHYDMPVEKHSLKEKVRRNANHYVTGRDGGREIDLRKFATEGMRLYGRLDTLAEGRVTFEPNLTRNLDNADAVYNGIRAAIDKHIREQGIDAPIDPPYSAPWAPDGDPLELDLAAEGIRSVVWCTGFRSNFGWVEVPVFDGAGQPVHRRGVTGSPGLYFLGLPWLHTWGSGRFSGVARDAGHVVDRIAARPVDAMPLQAVG
ncbi:MSMEG_0569 family flavin-dependent oxidoreductase [Azospirillum sp. SYSU D00513]|uniref:MSMEG_0569 family flavin-dependent oxidoreductase n=1 Tax=Azospirillum sp. SYSU D00513 TaxID=2812561 RepID=UPI001A964B94|nr:MSMEG_0569 family flavin-dependent oxidoreductase [Azospirillum sp. SYSU D00513]